MNLPHLSRQMRAALRRLSTLDVRSLAVFRIAIACALIWDLATAMSSVKAFYTNEGFMPVSLIEKYQTSPWLWSLHAWNGSTWWVVLLLIVQMLAAVCLLLGLRTQTAVVVSWALLCSLHARNLAILHSGDVALRLFLFWGMFLPLGARWSADALRRQWRDGRESEQGQEAGDEAQFTSPACLAILLQIAHIYFMGAVMKNGAEWIRDYTAIYYALSLDQFVTPAGRALLSFPAFCKAATFSTWWLEIIGPLLLFIPWHLERWRLAVTLSFWLLHIGLWICLRLGPFPLIMMAGWLVCVPSFVWERLARDRKAPGPLHRDDKDPAGIFPSWLQSRPVSGFVVLCTVYVLLWNLRIVDARWQRVFPHSLDPFGYALQLHQYWPMFAPRPTVDDGWLIMEAQLADGSRIDLLRDCRTVSFAKPPVISAEFKDSKWQKIIINLWRSPYWSLRASFGNHLAFQWNEAHPQRQIRGWTIWYMREDTPPPGTPPPPVKKIQLERAGRWIEE